jgi:hypothetical protein
MTPAERIEKAFNDAHVVLAAYYEPGPRNCEETLDRLMRILDNRELYTALVALLRAENPERTFTPY